MQQVPDSRTPNRRSRAPRFRRTTTRPFRLTQRDHDIIRALSRHKVLRSTHFDTLFAPADRGRLRQRLFFLYHHKLIQRPREQVVTMLERKGSQSLIYTLAPGGVRWLRERETLPMSPTATKKLGQLTHAIEVSDVLVSIEAACRRSEFLEFVSFPEILRAAPDVARQARTADEWKVKVKYDDVERTLFLRPDAIFAIRHRVGAASGNPSATKYFYLEADRGGMPVVRPKLYQSSILRKLLAYDATDAALIHQKRFGMNNFRALFVTKSPERVESMIAAFQKHMAQASPRIFLFIDRERLLANERSVLEALWRDGEGVERTLVS